MMKDKALEEIFQSSIPKFDDSAAFMSRLNRRLEAVEYIKQYEEANLRRYKIGMLTASVLSIICGCGMLLFLWHLPADLPLYAWETQTKLTLLLQSISKPLMTTGLAVLAALGGIGTTKMVLDLNQLSAEIKTK